MEVYESLVAAISNQLPEDKRRIYAVVNESAGCDPSFVIATSPAQAALAVIGEHHVVLVSQRERYDATRQALHETIEAHNAKVDAKK